jgi:hypothetical protein
MKKNPVAFWPDFVKLGRNKTIGFARLPMHGRNMKKLLFVLLFLASSAYGDIYTWKDSRGTVHYTNDQYEIPEKYRAKAKVLNLGIVEKKDNSSPQQNAPPQQNVPPQQSHQQAQPVKPEHPADLQKPAGNPMREHRAKRARPGKSPED